MRKIALVLMGVLAFSAVAQAEIIWRAEQAPVAGTGLTAWTFYLDSDSDVRNDWVNSLEGVFTGEFNQVALFGGAFPILRVNDLAYGAATPAERAADTMILIPGSAVATVIEPSQSGTTLNLGTMGLFPGNEQKSLAVAQLVVPTGTQWSFQGNYKAFNMDNFATLDILVPEPATMALLGLGALGLIARKRRTA